MAKSTISDAGEASRGVFLVDRNETKPTILFAN
jgi:hypothetical protein